jgi:pimeloyl-ACP methyl ester carboxylesterase
VFKVVTWPGRSCHTPSLRLEKSLVAKYRLTANRAVASRLTTIALLNKFAPKRCAPLTAKLFMSPRRRARSVNDKAVLASAGPVETISGIKSMCWGDPRRPKVLIVHGWESRASHFGALIRGLTDAGRSVVAFDGPAHGDSEGSLANVYIFATTILKMKEHWGELDTVIGHSMGAAALVYALAHGLKAGAMVHISGPGKLAQVLERFSNRLQLSAATREYLLPCFEKMLGTKVEELDNCRWASQLTMPALFIHDPEDQEVPFAEAAAVAANWQGAMVYRANGMGHTRILRARETVELITRFVITRTI